MSQKKRTLYTLGMASLQPLTTGNSLLAKVQALFDQKADASEWDLRLLLSEAEKLAKTSAVEASFVKAGIAVLKWNSEEVLYWVKNAVRLDPSLYSYLNASVMLRLVGEVEVAADYAESAISIAPNNAEQVVRGSHALIFDGRFKSGLTVLNALTSTDEFVEKARNGVRSRIEYIEDSGTTESQVQQQVRIAAQVAKSHRARVMGMNTSGHHDPTDGSKSFVVEFFFLGDMREELELEDALADEFSRLEDWDPSRLSVEFKYVKEDELHAKGFV